MKPDKIFPYGKIQSVSDIGQMVRQRRKQLGMGLIETAAVCNVGVRFLSEFERGKLTVQLGKALEILHALGFEVACQLAEDRDDHA